MLELTTTNCKKVIEFFGWIDNATMIIFVVVSWSINNVFVIFITIAITTNIFIIILVIVIEEISRSRHCVERMLTNLFSVTTTIDEPDSAAELAL